MSGILGIDPGSRDRTGCVHFAEAGDLLGIKPVLP